MLKIYSSQFWKLKVVTLAAGACKYVRNATSDYKSFSCLSIFIYLFINKLLFTVETCLCFCGPLQGTDSFATTKDDKLLVQSKWRG